MSRSPPEGAIWAVLGPFCRKNLRKLDAGKVENRKTKNRKTIEKPLFFSLVFKVSECIWELSTEKNYEKSKKLSQERLGEQKIEDKRAANREIAQNIGPKHTNIGPI